MGGGVFFLITGGYIVAEVEENRTSLKVEKLYLYASIYFRINLMIFCIFLVVNKSPEKTTTTTTTTTCESVSQLSDFLPEVFVLIF